MSLSPYAILASAAGTTIATSTGTPGGADLGLVVRVAGNVGITGSLTSITNPVAVTGTFWQATQPVSIAGSIAVTGPLTDTQLRATPVPVSGTVTVGSITSITNPVAVTGTFWQATQPVSIAGSVAVTGPLTDTQLRATPVPIDGIVTINNAAATLKTNAAAQTNDTAVAVTVHPSTASLPVTGTFWQATQPVSIAGSIAVTGPLTDTQLRATPVPVSGTFYQATQPVSIAASVAVTGPLTDVQLRATPVAIDGIVTINNAAATLKTNAAAIAGDTAVAVTVHPSTATMPISGTLTGITNPVAVTGTFWQNTQPVSIASTISVQGDKTSNGAVPGANNLGVLAAIATNAAPSYTEGRLVGLSTDLTGALRITGSISASNPSVSATGAAIPASATMIGGTNSGTLRAVAVDASGVVQTNVTNAAATLKTGAAAIAGDTAVAVTIHPSTASMPVSGSLTTVSTVTAVTSITNPVAVTGTFWQTTQPVSIASTISVQGAKTNNNAAPGATNIGAFGGVATAAVPTYVEGNQVAESIDLKGSVRSVARPVDVAALGAYSIGTFTGTIAATMAANISIWAFRTAAAGTNLFVIRKVTVSVQSVGAPTAGTGRLNLYVARSFTASYTTNGTAATISGNNGKKKTSMGTTSISQIYTNNTSAAGITGATVTLDTHPFASATFPITAVANTNYLVNYVLYDASSSGADAWPIVLAANEGLVIQNGIAWVGASSTWIATIRVEWEEVPAGTF